MRLHRPWGAREPGAREPGAREARAREQGAALVEAAIIVPLLMVLTFGALEFGFALSDASGMRSAVRSGARIGAALSKQSGQLQSIVDAVDSGLGSVDYARASHLLVYAGPPASMTGAITDCTAASVMCVDINVLSSRNTFDARTFLAQWRPSSESACVGSAWKLGVTVVASYDGITTLVKVPHKFVSTMLIDLEPTLSGSCSPL